MDKESLLVIKNKSEVLFLQLDDILYIQADRNYSNSFSSQDKNEW